MLRVLRLFKLFRLIEEVPYLKQQVDSFFTSISKIGNILVPIIVVLFLFAVVGLHLLSGLTEYRCRVGEEPVNSKWPADLSVRKLCGQYHCPKEYEAYFHDPSTFLSLTCGATSDYGLEF